MIISNICIKRPVFATVLSLLIILLGTISYSKLSIKQYPNIEPPVVSVSTWYIGANSDVIESSVTNVLEEQLSGIEGLENMTSTSMQNSSNIQLTFSLNTDLERAVADVRDKIALVRNSLPKDSDQPRVEKTNSSDQPIIYLAFFGDNISEMSIVDAAERFVKPRLETLAGVSSVEILSGALPVMHVWPDKSKLASYSVSVLSLIHI